MVHIQWKDRYNIGYKDIDEQHKILLDVLNEMMDMAGEGGDPALVTDMFHRLYTYVVTHFSAEERYMKACRYPRLAEHQALHGAFVQKLLELNNAYDPEDPNLLSETLEFLKHWYLDHIIKSDTDYVPAVKRYHAEAPIHAVLFGFGNLLGAFDHGRLLDGLSTLCGKPAGELKDDLSEASPLIQQYQRGEIDSPALLAGVSGLCGTDIPEADFVRVYAEVFTPNPAALELLRKIKRNHKVGLLANTGPWPFEQTIRSFELFDLFDCVTLSFEAGAGAPDPSFFEYALTKLDLMAEECVFVDDHAPFAQAATEHLLHGIAYTSPLALMTDLRRHRVIF